MGRAGATAADAAAGLDVERKARPVVPQIHIYENEGGRNGIDPQPGRQPALAAYRTPDELVRQPAPAA